MCRRYLSHKMGTGPIDCDWFCEHPLSQLAHHSGIKGHFVTIFEAVRSRSRSMWTKTYTLTEMYMLHMFPSIHLWCYTAGLLRACMCPIYVVPAILGFVLYISITYCFWNLLVLLVKIRILKESGRKLTEAKCDKLIVGFLGNLVPFEGGL